MAEACLALGLPVIGGNVSLYNESGGADIDPTPVLGVLGLVDRLCRPPARGRPWSDGDTLVLLDASVGTAGDRRGAPSLAGLALGRRAARPPQRDPAALDLAGHRRLVAFVAGLVARRWSARRRTASCGGPRRLRGRPGGGPGRDGRRSGLGVRVAGVADHHELFTEAPSRVVVVHDPEPRAQRAGGRGRGRRPGPRRGRRGPDRRSGTSSTWSSPRRVRSWRGRLPDLLDGIAPVTN